MKVSIVLLLVALGPILDSSAQPQVPDSEPIYARAELCKLPTDKVTTKHVSVDAEFVTALPHGLYLRDRRCKKILQIDFPDTDLDPSVAFVEKHVFELDGAMGTFRGVLKRDPATRRVHLWLQSVVNLQSNGYLPELDKNGPIHLPEPPMPKWPQLE